MMRSYCCLLAIAVLAPASMMGQSGEPGVGELSVYGGTVATGGHALVGASSGIAFGRYGIGLLDLSYARFGDTTLRYMPGLISQGSNFYDFNGSLHFRLPIKRQWAPYAIMGPSLLWNTYRYARTTPAGTVWTSQTDTNFGFRTGAGVRYYVTPNWGIRPEVRVIISNQTFVTVSAGVFFNLPE